MKKLNLKQLGIFCMLLFLAFPVLSRAEVIKVRVILSNSNVRLKPEIDSMILATVPVGTELESVERIEVWFKVKLPPDEEGFEVTGYIHGSMVEVVIEKDVEDRQVIQPEKPVTQLKRPDPQVFAQTQKRLYPPKKTGTEVGLRLFGDGNYLLRQNDFDDYIKAVFDKNEVLYGENPNVTLGGEFFPMEIGYGGGAEFFLNFIPEIGIGLGVGYVQQHKQSVLSILNEDLAVDIDDTFQPKITAIPVTLSMYFGLPVGEFLRIVAFGGVGYYFGRIELFFSDFIKAIDDSYQNTLSETWSAESNTFGFHGGLNFELNINRWLSLIIGGGGRFVEWKNLSGDLAWSYEDESGKEESTQRDLSLWFGEYKTFGKWYPQISYSVDKPSGSEWRNVRNGEVALTGVFVQLGLKFKFATFSTR